MSSGALNLPGLKKSLKKTNRVRSNSVGSSPVLRSSAKKRDRELEDCIVLEQDQDKGPGAEPAYKRMSRAQNQGAAAPKNNKMSALLMLTGYSY